jgi:Ferritin-like domain/TAT (twin-arginine translocation) pathway signal sequence
MSGVEDRVPIGLDRETSRRNFLKTAALTGAAFTAMGVGGFGVAVRRAEAQGEYKTYEGLGDAAIVQFAYQLELLEGTFYAEGVNAGLFADAFLEQIIAIRDHEMAHADALATTLGQLGAEVPATPEFTFPAGAFGDAATFLELAATFEPVGIGAYQGAAPALESKDILAAAISIHNAECQHRCAINILNLITPPNNLAFEEALPLQDVQEAVAPFGITG